MKYAVTFKDHFTCKIKYGYIESYDYDTEKYKIRFWDDTIGWLHESEILSLFTLRNNRCILDYIDGVFEKDALFDITFERQYENNPLNRTYTYYLGNIDDFIKSGWGFVSAVVKHVQYSGHTSWGLKRYTIYIEDEKPLIELKINTVK